MEPRRLAEVVANLIGSIPVDHPGGTGRPLRKLLWLVDDQLSLSDRENVLTAFRGDPHDWRGKADLITELIGEFGVDGDFHDEVRQLVAELTRVDIWRRKVDVSGFSIPVSVLIASTAAVVLLGGAGVLVNVETPTLSGESTCRDWLAADPDTQAATLRRLYLGAGRTEHATDPYMVRNDRYFCDSRPDLTLAKLVSSRP